MKKLIYLKKYNESVSEDECDFETFKEIMYDISDHYHCEFIDYSNEESPFYDCKIILSEYPDVYEVSSAFGSNLEEVAFYDGPEDFYIVKNKLREKINQNIETLKDLKSQIDSGIRYNEKISNIVKIIEEEVIERLQTFKNFEELSIGIGWLGGQGILRVCFDIVEKE